MIYKIRKEEVNTLLFTLLITFSLITGVKSIIYTAYYKLNITSRNLDELERNYYFIKLIKIPIWIGLSSQEDKGNITLTVK